nr:MAG TPA: hypothetical protein [Caudoviricetes sp.]
MDMILSEKNRRRAKEKWMVTGRTGRKAVCITAGCF